MKPKMMTNKHAGNQNLLARLFAGALIGTASGVAADNQIVIIDGKRIFTVDEFTEYFADGDGVDAKFFQQVGTGKPAQFNVKSGANEELTTGLLDRIELLTELSGPVTSIRPLTIFRQQIVLADRTVIQGIDGGLATLTEGDELEVSGFTSRLNLRRATRLSGFEDPLDEWRLTGFISDVTDTSFQIGFQPVLLNGVTPTGCDAPLQRGDYVEVRATPDPEFSDTLLLQSTTAIRCIDRRVDRSAGGLIPATVDGFITRVDGDSGFTVAQQPVSLLPSTVYENGRPESVALGVRVAVQGVLDTDTGILEARQVTFADVRVLLEGPVAPEDIVPGESIVVLGQTLQSGPETVDPAGILDIGLSRTTQVEARGFSRFDGAIVLTALRPTGLPDFTDVDLRGPVEQVSRPEFNLLGLTVDASAAVFEQGDAVIDADTFFAAVDVESQVRVTDATFEPTTNTIVAGTIVLEQVARAGGGSGAASDQGAGIGTITLSQDCVFVAGFEAPDDS